MFCCFVPLLYICKNHPMCVFINFKRCEKSLVGESCGEHKKVTLRVPVKQSNFKVRSEYTVEQNFWTSSLIGLIFVKG